ncbi:MAG: hypothetical protein QOJ99_4308 [Bryobacterales bacterium]|jgi:hypothetical protein|nr:hypothetical protein [Bryobacterales bacterium]
MIYAPFEEAIQFEPLPQFQSEKTRAELPGSFQPHFVQQHTRYLRIIRRRSYMRREQFHCCASPCSLNTSTVVSQRACAELFSSPR